MMAANQIAPLEVGIVGFDFPQEILKDGGAFFTDKIAPEELRAQVDGTMRMLKEDHACNLLAFVSRQQQEEAAKAFTANVRSSSF